MARFSTLLRTLVATPALAILAACSSVGPHFPSVQEASPLESSQREQNLAAAEALYKQILHRPRPETITEYNRAVSQLLRDQFGRPGRIRHLPANWGSWINDGDETVDPATYDQLFPASTVRSATRIDEPKTIEGIGVACVGWSHTDTPSDPATNFLPPTGISHAVTAVLTFENGDPQWRLYERYDQESVTIGGRELPLAGDFSAALAVFEDRCELSDFGILELLLPEEYYKDTGIFAADDYDPDKIPIVFIHGVNSNPFSFIQLIDRLVRYPEVRKNFQFYFFYYPTGEGWIFSASNFRDSVQQLRPRFDPDGTNPNFDQMVVVAHSMGGLITRASVSTNPEVIYNSWFSCPIDELRGSSRNRELMRKTFAYQPLTGIERVIFMATPHRGSKLANIGILTLISKLMKLPAELSTGILDVVTENGINLLEGNVENFRVPTSIDELSPDNRTIKAVSNLRFPDEMHVHSVIGSRLGKLKTDGIVPYWSSHIDEAESERVIESNHSVPKQKMAAEETLRILREHLTETGRD